MITSTLYKDSGTSTLKHTRKYTNMHTHAHTHTYAHTHMHTHTRTHTHTNTHTHTCIHTEDTRARPSTEVVVRPQLLKLIKKYIHRS